MKNLKVKLCIIVALAATIIVTLGIFLGNIAMANRNLTLSGTSIFNTSGDAEVWAHRIYVGTGEEDTDATFDQKDPNYMYYTMFTFQKNGDSVMYRRNLAYQWFYNTNDFDDYRAVPYKGANNHWWIRDIDTGIEYDSSDDCEVNDDGYWVIGENVTTVQAKLSPNMGIGYLRLEIGFEEVNFEKFVLSFETQQLNMTKDEKTTNYVIFLPAEDDDGNVKVYAVITDDKDIAEGEAEDIKVDGLVMLDIDHIVIQLSEGSGENGEFAVSVSTEGAEQTGIFANVGKMYAKYVSSSTKPVVPLTFSAKFAEDEDGNLLEGQKRARMAIYELNGQSFVLNRNALGEVVSTSRSIYAYEDADGIVHYEGGQVNDIQPPVLCLDSGISFVKKNSELTFSYTAVDVLTQSPSIVTGFFMLTNAQAGNADFNPNDFEADGLFKTVTSDEDVYMTPHSNHYIPEDGKDFNVGKLGTAFNSSPDPDGQKADFIPTAALKIYLKLTDTASTGGQSTYVFLDWFVEDQYKLNIGGYNYIAVATDEEGATFNYGSETHRFDTPEGRKIIDAYQAKVDEAAKDLLAGSDADFYLPSLEMLVGDNATAYKDMTFSIYYMVNGNTMSNTGRSASQLYIDLATDGDYIFTVYATDSSSNKMWYIDDDGKFVEFAANEIWTMYDDKDEEGLKERLPWFKFTAGISDISVEDPGEQSTAYVGTSYTASSFKVVGISTKTSHTLYLFDQKHYAEDNGGKVLTYQEFMEYMKDDNDIFDAKSGLGRKYFINIMAQSELDEDTDEYEKFYNYAWNPSSRSFIPQEANAFYVIKCEVTSARFPTRAAVSEYMGIASSATPKALKGEDTWVQDNLLSIILLSIAAVAFIGIILLIFIKPKNNADVDVQFQEEVAKKSK